MDNLFDSYQFFLCKITLKKYNFIGINYKSIVMLITSDNKILLVKFNENKILFDLFKKYYYLCWELRCYRKKYG